MLPLLDSDTPLPDDPTGAWTQYGANGANTFAANVSAPPQGNLAWTSDVFTRWRPAVSDGMVYTTNFDPSNDGSAIALDAQDGTEQWRTTLDASGDNVLVVVDDRCVVAYDKELVALDSQTGEQIWTESINEVEQLVADEATGAVLVASDRGIEVFRAADGERRWETNTVRQLVHAPAVYDGRVFAVGDVDGSPSLAAFSVEDGSDRWQSELTATPESAAPVATQDGVFVADDRTLVVHDRETGDQRRELGSFGEDDDVVPHTMAVDDGTVFVTSSYGAIAVDSETGTVRWHRDTPVYKPGICLGTDTIIFPVSTPEFAPEKKTISAFDRGSGEMRWYYGFDPGFHHEVTSPPVLVDGAVFFTATDIDGLGALGDVPKRND
ncbi:Outer membrane protein assembly factor BamB, contains PQQ-like beta-propeller repeat [Halopenitus malekzadehii]|uniref:Outer membrane protein assembly factor BamB, contains PQQ-like beta-propeller repeat n=1 Tax=Halopenitus malekzadehii TaxID=1267564 RepID=A0A1H6IZW5_9EURY|nr:PQQ-binding-like beta-propeller repeat protein [Halopenitus malekzadehii]SEH53833.1 Outer membrane protein assembly factor BamB, contains PQQ-like beta-propeller repeat [Halopenitus malekzadehii]